MPTPATAAPDTVLASHTSGDAGTTCRAGDGDNTIGGVPTGERGVDGGPAAAAARESTAGDADAACERGAMAGESKLGVEDPEDVPAPARAGGISSPAGTQ